MVRRETRAATGLLWVLEHHSSEVLYGRRLPTVFREHEEAESPEVFPLDVLAAAENGPCAAGAVRVVSLYGQLQEVK